MEFIGDLSIADAEILIRYGEEADRILEFGAGGSTQIFAQCYPVKLWSVETSGEWVAKTKDNIKRLGRVTDPVFLQFGEYPPEKVDLIFVDGVWDKRLEFAITSWLDLAIGGHMIFHDTRRWFDAENVFKVCAKFYDEVDHVLVNEGNSNCTVIKKRQGLEYENWNETEGKPKWAYGAEERPD